MIPTYLRDEILLRLAACPLDQSKLKTVCQLLDIDLEGSLNPTPTVEDIVAELPLSLDGAATFSAAIDFDFETRCGNHVRSVTGRIVYASQGLNALGQIGRTTSTCQVLTWDPDAPSPSWEQMPEDALPDGLVRQLCERVLDAVIEQQRQAEIDS